MATYAEGYEETYFAIAVALSDFAQSQMEPYPNQNVALSWRIDLKKLLGHLDRVGPFAHWGVQVIDGRYYIIADRK